LAQCITAEDLARTLEANDLILVGDGAGSHLLQESLFLEDRESGVLRALLLALFF
jgi:hypothetical protein